MSGVRNFRVSGKLKSEDHLILDKLNFLDLAPLICVDSLAI
jgi:hypothetical protein